VFEWNPASMRILEKAGLQREGTLKKSATKDGLLIDSVMYAYVLLADRSQRPSSRTQPLYSVPQGKGPDTRSSPVVSSGTKAAIAVAAECDPALHAGLR